MHRLNPNSELSQARVGAGGSRLEMRKGTEVIRFRKPGASREKHKNNTNEASMLLKTHDSVGKRTQNEPKIAAKTHSFCRKRSKICAPHYVGAWRAEAVVADPGDDRAPRAVSRDFQSKAGLDDVKGQVKAAGLTPERYSGILDAGLSRIVPQDGAEFAEPEARPDIRLFARLAIMPEDQPAARTLRVLKHRPLLVRLVDVRSEIQLFVFGQSSPLLLSGMPPPGRIGTEEWD